MAIIGGLFAALGRFAGKLVTMVLGWASVLLFGRVPQKKQLLLAMITLGSIAWVAALVGVIIPDVGSFLLAAIPRPEFIDELWIRLAMIAVAIVLPLVIGFLTILVLDEARRPKGLGLVVQVLRGYLYAPVLAVMLVVLAGIALWRKGTALARRWQDAHVAVIVKPGGYEQVVSDLERALSDAGVEVRRAAAPAALTIPPKLVAAVGGAAVAALVPDELISLKGDQFSALVYPSDIARREGRGGPRPGRDRGAPDADRGLPHVGRGNAKDRGPSGRHRDRGGSSGIRPGIPKDRRGAGGPGRAL